MLQPAEAFLAGLIFLEVVDTPGLEVLYLAKDDFALAPPLIRIHRPCTLCSNMIRVAFVGNRSRRMAA